MNEKNKIQFILTALVLLIIVGTVGYSILLDTPIIDSLYMTIITISTVGYSEVANMTFAAKIFTMIIIFWGVGVGGYTFTTLIVMIIEGTIKDIWRNKMVENKISRLQDHYILCGAGETGEIIIEQFKKNGSSFVVIENKEAVYKDLINHNILAVYGDATEEDVLNKAQIKKARGLISSLSKDVDNIVTVLTARQMNQELYIISRAIDKNAPSKLKKAGANNTISSNEIGGRRMAALMIRPAVISFLDVMTRVGDIELDLEDILINEGSEIVGKSLKDIRIPQKTGLIVLAYKKQENNEIVFNPDPDELFRKGDTLLVLGTESQVSRVRELAKDSGDRLPFIF